MARAGGRMLNMYAKLLFMIKSWLKLSLEEKEQRNICKGL